MNRKVVFLCAMVFVLGVVTPRITPTAEAQDERQVWAYFLGWYTQDSWNDGRLLDRPIGRYNSFDDGRIGDQIEMAKGAGIDAFIHTWLGRGNNNLTDIVLNKALGQAAGRGFKIGVSVDMVGDGWLTTEDAVRTEMQYLMENIVNHSAYLRYNGKPVIYFWNQDRFSASTWRSIREQIDPNRNTIWISEGASTSLIPTFDGIYLFNTAWSRNPAGTAQQYAYLTRNAGGTFYTPTVMPGWNEDAVAITQNRTNPTEAQDRGAGRFLYDSWVGATSARTDVILVVSWNEYFENSHIEPSELHGWSAIDTLRPLIESWKTGSAVPAAPVVPVQEEVASNEQAPVEQVAASAPGAPTGVTYTAGYNMNVRAVAGTDGAVLGQLSFSAVVDVVGRNASGEWVKVNFQGQSGWVASGLGTLSAGLNTLPTVN